MAHRAGVSAALVAAALALAGCGGPTAPRDAPTRADLSQAAARSAAPVSAGASAVSTSRSARARVTGSAPVATPAAPARTALRTPVATVPRPSGAPTPTTPRPPVLPAAPAMSPAMSPAARAACPAAAAACVNIDAQIAWLQHDGQLTYGPVPIATGRPGLATPRGSFSVLRKDEHHISNIYDEPMPYAVFFTEYGIAFHEGALDDSSHGCVHLSWGAAARFFASLDVGAQVVVG